MRETIDTTLDKLRESGNFRTLPQEPEPGMIDFTSNDYLGLGSREDLRREFFDSHSPEELLMSASASRLLAACQNPFARLEKTLETAYGGSRRALAMNSGYHANSGLIPALAGKNTTILADRLVHASIIDGIKLSGAEFSRFRHNDLNHLISLADKANAEGRDILIVVESVYSMDGDRADIDALEEIKRNYPGAILYVDEAHAVGVEGPHGLGLVAASAHPESVDITIGTFGKALASAGAFALMSESMRHLMINRCRSFIFSTALPPACALWTEFIFNKSLDMDTERNQLRQLGNRLCDLLSSPGDKRIASHIQPWHVGDPHKAVELSRRLKEHSFNVLPIRVPTVPPGTDRLRISLNAALTQENIESLASTLKELSE